MLNKSPKASEAKFPGTNATKWISTIPRWLYAITFGGFGLMHLTMGNDLTGYVPDFLPGDVFWVYLTGAAMIAASISFIIEKKVRLAALLIALMLLIFILTVHIPHYVASDKALENLTGLFLDLAIAGGALLLAGQYPTKNGGSNYK